MKTVALLLALAGTLAAFAVGQTGWAASSGKTQLHLIDIPKAYVPVGASSQHQTPQPGDQVLLTDELYTWNGAKRGAHIGRLESSLNFRAGFSFEKGGLCYLVGQLFLPDGSIMVEGFAKIGSGNSVFVIPVVGGTGKYAGARGTLSSRDIGPGNGKSSMTLNLDAA
jgi:hypothetical protein